MTPKYKSAFTVTESGGRQNMYAVEPKTDLIETDYATQAELVNGQLAMVGFVAMIGAYALTGNIIPVYSKPLLFTRSKNNDTRSRKI